MTPTEIEARLAAQGIAPATWSNEPGDRYSAHSHAYDKVLVATRGSITFHLVDTGSDIVLAAGERLDLPAGTAHAATVGPVGVACLEAHLVAGTLADAPRHRLSGDW